MMVRVLLSGRTRELTRYLTWDGATICVTSGTTTEGNLADAFREANLDFTPAVFAETEAAFGTFDEGGCDAYTSDKSQLASLATHVIESRKSDNITRDDL